MKKSSLKLLGTILSCSLLLSLVGCNSTNNKTYSLIFSAKNWSYDQTNQVYYQIGVTYCQKPATSTYETMAIYVPAAYMNGKKNRDGTYTCTVKKSGTVGNYTAKTAPIVFPINTPGYSAQAAPTSYNYNDISAYLKAGMIYVYAGMRGRENGYDSSGNLAYSGGAPWGVTDLKAAIRYYRYNASLLPGNPASIFTFGMSGGGAQSALVGATGDSKLYTKYLKAIGAAMTDKNGNTISDAIAGAMCWCPITSLDQADAAYEWNMGQYFSTNTRASNTYTSVLSQDLAKEYAQYLNNLQLTDSAGNVLTLTESSTGIYTAGTYYDYLKKTLETSLNNFLADTSFPYTISSSSGPGQNSSSTTYQTVTDYIASLNKSETWINYDSSTNTATITSVAAFIKYCKNPSKSVGAFDALDRSTAENNLFGNDSKDSLHFNSIMANLLKNNASTYNKYSNWKNSLITAYTKDLTKKDSLGTTIANRLNMYNPMYYLCSYYKGYQTATVAKYWRIRSGTNQGDTANTTEINLALALNNYSEVKSVDFATVWGQGHTMAERTGNSTSNFIKWIQECTITT